MREALAMRLDLKESRVAVSEFNVSIFGRRWKVMRDYVNAMEDKIQGITIEGHQFRLVVLTPTQPKCH